MPSTFELLEKFYGTRDVYSIFGVAKTATEGKLKKAYYKLSLKVHPDRVGEFEKDEATEKFKVLSKVYAILSDKAKRALYDEQGIIDDDDDSSTSNWISIWQQFFKPITVEDITEFEKEYVGSETERNDIKKAYLNGKGCINYLIDHVQFMQCEDEPRIIGIIKELIADGEVPEFKICTEEPAVKRNRRHKRYAREAKEAAALQKERGSLEQQIAANHEERKSRFNAFCEKYSHPPRSEVSISIDVYDAQLSNKKSPKSKKTPPKKNISKGRVSKKTG